MVFDLKGCHPEQRGYMKVFVQAIESGGQVKPEELFCKGTKIKSADWHVKMGC